MYHAAAVELRFHQWPQILDDISLEHHRLFDVIRPVNFRHELANKPSIAVVGFFSSSMQQRELPCQRIAWRPKDLSLEARV